MHKTSTSISLLLGAGFSAPKGYPTGRTLNSLILNSKNENIAFHTSGSLVINKDGTKPDLDHKSSHQIEFDFFMSYLNTIPPDKKNLIMKNSLIISQLTYIRMQVQGELQKFLPMTIDPLIHYFLVKRKS